MTVAVEPSSINQPVARRERSARWPVVVAAVVLAALVGAVFFPVLGFEFVDFDTYEQVIDNPYIKSLSPENLKHIFTTRCITSYYPVRTLTFALDHQLWGLQAGGFKLTNVVIHLANTLLVFWLALRLVVEPSASREGCGRWTSVATAGFAAAVFGLHPVVVEPVIWIPGREELLMTLGALGTIHFHIAARRASDAGTPRRQVLACHAAAVFCCGVACLSNAVGAIIPMLVLAWDVLMLDGGIWPIARRADCRLTERATTFRRKVIRIGVATAPLWIISAATVVTKTFGQPEETVVDLVHITWTGRLMIGLNAYWLNLKTLFWPDELCLYYDWLYPQGFLDRNVLVGLAAVTLTLGALWSLRRRKLVLFGLLWFGLTLAPTLQIRIHHIHRADRFMYLPLVGIATVIALTSCPLVERLKARGTLATVAALGLPILAALATRSAIQVGEWRTSLGVWQHCLTLNADNARAHDAIADHFARHGQCARAISHYETVLRLRPFAAETLENYAYHLATWDPNLRDYDRAMELAERARAVTAGRQRQVLETLADVRASYAFHLQQQGDYARAIQEYERALKVDLNHAPAAYNLALLLATCPNESLRQVAQAVSLAELAGRMNPTPDFNAYLVQATVYAQAGRFGAAAVATQNALDLAQDTGDLQCIDGLRRQLEVYQTLAGHTRSP